MPNEYTELYAWTHATFGDREFTIADFRDNFPSPDPKKVLSDLRRLGYARSESRGRYRVVAPSEWLDSMIERGDRSLDIPEAAGLPYAYSHDTAITIWTDGGYWTGFTRGFRPVHMDVPKQETAAWMEYFKNAGARAVTDRDRKTLFGVVHVLHPVERVRPVNHHGVSVIPIADALAFAEERPFLYEPVITILRRRVTRRHP